MFKVIKTKNQVIFLRTKITESEQKHKVFEEEEKEIKKTLKVCPLCDKNFD